MYSVWKNKLRYKIGKVNKFMKKIVLVISLIVLMASSVIASPQMDLGILCGKGDTNYSAPIYRIGLASGAPDGLILKANAELSNSPSLYSLTADYNINNRLEGRKNAIFSFGAGAYKIATDTDVHFGGFVALDVAVIDNVYFVVKYTEIDKTTTNEGLQCGFNVRF